MWTLFVAGSRPCSEMFYRIFLGFPLYTNANISKFQFPPGNSAQRATLGILTLQSSNCFIAVYCHLKTALLQLVHRITYTFRNTALNSLELTIGVILELAGFRRIFAFL